MSRYDVPAGDQYQAPAGDQYQAPAGDQHDSPGSQQYEEPASPEREVQAAGHAGTDYAEDSIEHSPWALTGNAEVDAILAGLNGLDRLPAADHIAVFERVHRGLQDILSEAADDSARPPAPDDSWGS